MPSNTQAPEPDAPALPWGRPTLKVGDVVAVEVAPNDWKPCFVLEVLGNDRYELDVIDMDNILVCFGPLGQEEEAPAEPEEGQQPEGQEGGSEEEGGDSSDGEEGSDGDGEEDGDGDGDGDGWEVLQVQVTGPAVMLLGGRTVRFKYSKPATPEAAALAYYESRILDAPGARDRYAAAIRDRQQWMGSHEPTLCIADVIRENEMDTAMVQGTRRLFDLLGAMPAGSPPLTLRQLLSGVVRFARLQHSQMRWEARKRSQQLAPM